MAHSVRHYRLHSASIALTVLLCIVFLNHETARVACGQVPKMSAALAGQLRLIEARVVAGRIVAVSSNVGQNMSSSSTSNGRRERLSIKLTEAGPTVSYEMATAGEQLGFEIVAGDRVTLRRQYRIDQGTATIEFYQIPGRPIVVLTGPSEASVKIEAASLWHLFLAEPELCRQQIVPLMDLIRPDWKVAAMANDIEDQLIRASKAPVVTDQGAWERWVAELAASRYSQRQTADRRLRESGPKVLSFLQRIDRSRLDTEQSRRVRDIIRSIAGSEEEDTPERVPLWLADDPRAWYALLARDDAVKRKMAAEQLARLLKGPIDFDPNAPAATRLAKRAALAKRIEPAGQSISERPAPALPADAPAVEAK